MPRPKGAKNKPKAKAQKETSTAPPSKGLNDNGGMPVDNNTGDKKFINIEDVTDNIFKDAKKAVGGDGSEEMAANAEPLEATDTQDNETGEQGTGEPETEKKQRKKRASKEKPPLTDKAILSLVMGYLMLSEAIPLAFGLPAKFETNEHIKEVYVEGLTAWIKDNEIDLSRVYKYAGFVLMFGLPLFIMFHSYKERKKYVTRL